MPHLSQLKKINSSEITGEKIYRQRRMLIQASIAAALGSTTACADARNEAKKIANPMDATPMDKTLSQPVKASRYSTDEELTSIESATSYNNFNELGFSKGDPKKNAKQLKTNPWNVVVDGECGKPGNYTLEDILQPHAIEERIFRHRCVEAWSMVIPWNGFSLGDLLKRFEPNSNAKFVRFETVYDPDRLIGQRSRVLHWPYTEGLRIDEAMHPLATVAIGMYGQIMPNQSGAPIRLVLPWKYGFKSIKSIVRISFEETEPPTTWNLSSPREYGFYANVNPDVSHPRWSQRKERRLSGETDSIAALFTPKIDTLFLNGYADEVGSLYRGMDLRRYF